MILEIAEEEAAAAAIQKAEEEEVVVLELVESRLNVRLRCSTNN